MTSQGKWLNPVLGEENVEEEEREDDGTEETPAQPPVDAQLGVQHEVEISGDGSHPVDTADCQDGDCDESEEEESSNIEIHHTQYCHAPGCHIEQPNTVTL